MTPQLIEIYKDNVSKHTEAMYGKTYDQMVGDLLPLVAARDRRTPPKVVARHIGQEIERRKSQEQREAEARAVERRHNFEYPTIEEYRLFLGEQFEVLYGVPIAWEKAAVDPLIEQRFADAVPILDFNLELGNICRFYVRPEGSCLVNPNWANQPLYRNGQGAFTPFGFDDE